MKNQTFTSAFLGHVFSFGPCFCFCCLSFWHSFMIQSSNDQRIQRSNDQSIKRSNHRNSHDRLLSHHPSSRPAHIDPFDPFDPFSISRPPCRFPEEGARLILNRPSKAGWPLNIGDLDSFLNGPLCAPWVVQILILIEYQLPHTLVTLQTITYTITTLSPHYEDQGTGR